MTQKINNAVLVNYAGTRHIGRVFAIVAECAVVDVIAGLSTPSCIVTEKELGEFPVVGYFKKESSFWSIGRWIFMESNTDNLKP